LQLRVHKGLRAGHIIYPGKTIAGFKVADIRRGQLLFEPMAAVKADLN